MPRETTKKVPRDALQFAAGLEFAESDSQGEVSIRMLARSAEPINHWYWGKAIHDLEGYRPRRDRIQIDWCHRHDQSIGFADKFTADKQGLWIEGKLVSVREDDLASELIAKSRAGIPYEASIDFNGPGLRIEEIGEGVKVQVNGRTFEGPGVVFREWPLRSVAVCPFGADHRTKSQFSDDDLHEVDVCILSAEEPPMTKPADTPAPETKEQTAPEKPAENQPAETTKEQSQPQGQPPSQPAAPPDSRAQFTAELKRFTDKFGPENGAKWLAEGKSWEEALELHAQVLAEQVKAKDEELAAAHQKLASVDRGEQEPVTFSEAAGEGKDTPGEVPAKFAHLGENRARIAAGIKLPN